MCLNVDIADWTYLRDGWQTARKNHECVECRRTIEPGERYWSSTGVDHYANRVSTWKMCSHCRTLITVGAAAAGCPEAWWFEFVLDPFEEGVSFMYDIVFEHHHYAPGVRFRLMRYWVQARRKWRDRTGDLVPLPERIAA